MRHITTALSKVREEALKRPNLLLALASLPLLKFGKKFLCTSVDLLKDVCRSVPDLPKKYGENTWAVITGASDGLGEEFVYQLGEQGLNLVLIARNLEKTEKVASEVKKRHPSINVKVIIKDFTKSNEEGFFDDILSQLKDLEISILVNNVGIFDLKPFESSSEKIDRELILVNCFPVVLLTRAIIPSMLARKQRSAIINISSAAANRPYPYASIYSATKVFIDYFSRAINLEFSGKIDILSLKPAMLRTRNNLQASKDHFSIDTKTHVQSAFKALGRDSHTSGNWKHKLEKIRTGCLSNRVLTRIFKGAAVS